MSYDLFLFDLDGLLIDTEQLHFRAYQGLCQVEGFSLDWSFSQYARIAQLDNNIRGELFTLFPQLKRGAGEEEAWEILYPKKKELFLDLFHKEGAPLLPGVEEFLKYLQKKGKKRAIVTHSSRELVESIFALHPLLAEVDLVLAREDYEKAKPDPQAYQKAIDSLGGKTAIGFEDSPKGLRALLGSSAQAVLVGADFLTEEEKASFEAEGAWSCVDFKEILKKDLA